MVVFLLINELPLGSYLLPISAESKTWIVDDDGPADFKTIKEAISFAHSGDVIIVHEGYYPEGCMEINKSLQLLAKGRVVIDGLMCEKILRVEASNIIVSGFSFINGGQGIDLFLSSGTLIEKNIFVNCESGIRLYSSSKNAILQNFFQNCNKAVVLDQSDENEIKTNNISNANCAFSFDFSGFNLVENNTVNNTKSDLGFLYSSNNNSIIGNSFFNDNGDASFCIIGSYNIIRMNHFVNGSIMINGQKTGYPKMY